MWLKFFEWKYVFFVMMKYHAFVYSILFNKITFTFQDFRDHLYLVSTYGISVICLLKISEFRYLLLLETEPLAI